ncbi:MAG: hypothetical protein JW934_17655 [Anaerolineae bacterium]|nr:hypothetical protein [Anaerolineae bacterium]
MSRVVNMASVGQQRHQLRRTIAEALRLMMRKPKFDQESRDLAALIVFALRQIEEGIEQTASAWENRDYFLKADRFRREWDWLEDTTFTLESALLLGQFDRVPPILATLIPRFSDITINRFTRSPELWQGCYQRLLRDDKSS